mgnify:CR=1 FL=1
MSQTILDEIKTYKLQEIAADKALKSLAVIEAEALEASPTRGFAAALTNATKTGYGLIAEIKKASQSPGRHWYHCSETAQDCCVAADGRG